MNACARRLPVVLLAMAAFLLGPALCARGDIIKVFPSGTLNGQPGTLSVSDGDAFYFPDLAVGSTQTYDRVEVTGGLLNVAGELAIEAGGTVDLSGGEVRAFRFDAPGGGLSLTGGLIKTTAFNGNLANDGGTIQTWSNLGVDTIVDGDLTNNAGSISLALVNLYPQGLRQWRWNKLVVTGELTAGGTLDVSMLVITPSLTVAGLTFDLLDWGSLSGTFDQVNLPDLPAGLGWDEDDLYTSGEITIVPEPAALLLLAGGGAVLLARRRS